MYENQEKLREMSVLMEFNRDVKNDDYVVAGGFEFKSENKNMMLDFHHRDVSKYKDNTCAFTLYEMDVESFPEAQLFVSKDYEKIEKIKECFIYVGEEEETDLKVIAIKEIKFVFDSHYITLNENILKEFNNTLTEVQK